MLGDCIAALTGGRTARLATRPAVLGVLIGLAVNTLTPLEQAVLHRPPALVNRLDDIVQLARYADRFEDPRSFLSELNLLSSFASETVLEPSEPEKTLTLSSVHQAKGLEWRSVFVLALNEGAFPNPRSIHEEGGLEEERRLFYVALTRTAEQLYLLSRQVEDRPGRRRLLQKPSRFLDEVAGRDLFERWAIEEG